MRGCKLAQVRSYPGRKCPKSDYARVQNYLGGCSDLLHGRSMAVKSKVCVPQSRRSQITTDKELPLHVNDSVQTDYELTNSSSEYF